MSAVGWDLSPAQGLPRWDVWGQTWPGTRRHCFLLDVNSHLSPAICQPLAGSFWVTLEAKLHTAFAGHAGTVGKGL